jgi:hypothetical protein
LIPVKYLQQEWQGPTRYPVTVGPTLSHAAEVFGISGAYAGMHGSARETYDLRSFSAGFGIEALHGTLSVALDESNAVETELAAEPAATTAR